VQTCAESRIFFLKKIQNKNILCIHVEHTWSNVGRKLDLDVLIAYKTLINVVSN
jgi:hypothetical protein